MTKPSLIDVHKIPSDGYLVFPLSMSCLSTYQRPEEVYKLIELFEKKISAVGVDGVFLYTNGLYFNIDEHALGVRKKTNSQMLSHKNSLLRLISKGKKYIPQAMHFLPWDYVILNSPKFQEFYQILQEISKKDSVFRKFLVHGLAGRKRTDANISFLIEEIVVTHLIRQQLIEFPKTLVKQDKFRLIVYPGAYLRADLYQWKNKILPQAQNKDNKANPFYASQYNPKDRVLYNFDEIEL